MYRLGDGLSGRDGEGRRGEVKEEWVRGSEEGGVGRGCGLEHDEWISIILSR